MNLSEQGHFINALPAVDINGGAVTGDVFSMRNYRHATILITLGVTGAASTVTLKECTSFAAAGATAIAFSYYAEETASGDVLGARTAATVTGFATSTEDGIMYTIELDATELSDGSEYVQVCMSDPSAGTLVNIAVILSGGRYQNVESVTEIV